MGRPLGWLALGISLAAVLAAGLGGLGTYLAMGLGILAVAAGWVGYRRTGDPGTARLAGAGALTLGVLALGLSGLRYGMTLAAIGRLESLL